MSESQNFSKGTPKSAPSSGAGKPISSASKIGWTTKRDSHSGRIVAKSPASGTYHTISPRSGKSITSGRVTNATEQWKRDSEENPLPPSGA